MSISALESLLSQKKVNPDEIVKCKLYVERLDEEVEFSFKRLSYSKYKIFKRNAIERKRGSETFDIDKYRVSIILDCMVDPDFTKKEFIDSVGAPNGEVAISRVFLPGEIVSLGELILAESGFSEDPFRGDVSEDERPSGREK